MESLYFAALLKGSAMARDFKLTWFTPRSCWKKYCNGKMYYLGKGHCKGKYDTKGYDSALQEWDTIKASLNQTAGAARRSQELILTDRAELEIVALASQRRWYIENNPQILTVEQIIEREDALETVKRLSIPTPENQKVESIVESFLTFKKSQAVSGQKSNGRFVNVRIYIKQFGAFIGNEKNIKELTAITLADYHAHLLGKVAENEISSYTARDALQVAKQFTKRTWQLGLIELPKNLDSKDLEIRVVVGAISIYKIDILKKILNDAPDKLRLYLLLMANCGMTQKDISDLTVSQVDWQKGIIKRKRSKTEGHANVPIVSYPLWSSTFNLLKTYGNKDVEKTVNVFSNSDGGILVGTTLEQGKGNKASKVDIISKMFNEWINNTPDLDTLPLKYIRKTSSSLIGQSEKYKQFAQYFLCESARTVTDKFYVTPSEEQFTACILWLGEQYETLKVSEPQPAPTSAA